MKLLSFILLFAFAATLSAAPPSPMSTVVVSAAKPVAAKPNAAKPVVAAAAIDLNSADASTLAREMRGIGESKARAIVEYRRAHGPFRSIDDLALVKGIGARTIELNRAKLRVGAVTAARNAVR